MPELAEVEWFRKRWDSGLNREVMAVEFNRQARCCRDINPALVKRALVGSQMVHTEAAAKQIAFVFSSGAWLGVHLGMTGVTEQLTQDTKAGKHDHFILRFKTGPHLVFRDPRMFGKVHLWQGQGRPPWWEAIAPAILSQAFTPELLKVFLKRRARAPIKAVLLMQERFPGIGNWMADEVLWRAGFHPQAQAGKFGPKAQKTLYRCLRQVCRDALEVIGSQGAEPPNTWLFNHRWEDGGICPRSKKTLQRATVGGRTACWSPSRQRLGNERD